MSRGDCFCTGKFSLEKWVRDSKFFMKWNILKYNSGQLEVIVNKTIPSIFCKIPEITLLPEPLSNKIEAVNFIKIETLPHFFPVNFTKVLRKALSHKTSAQLLLNKGIYYISLGETWILQTMGWEIIMFGKSVSDGDLDRAFLIRS